jgi:hypothetical protein
METTMSGLRDKVLGTKTSKSEKYFSGIFGGAVTNTK